MDYGKTYKISSTVVLSITNPSRSIYVPTQIKFLVNILINPNLILPKCVTRCMWVSLLWVVTIKTILPWPTLILLQRCWLRHVPTQFCTGRSFYYVTAIHTRVTVRVRQFLPKREKMHFFPWFFPPEETVSSSFFHWISEETQNEMKQCFLWFFF